MYSFLFTGMEIASVIVYFTNIYVVPIIGDLAFYWICCGFTLLAFVILIFFKADAIQPPEYSPIGSPAGSEFAKGSNEILVD